MIDTEEYSLIYDIIVEITNIGKSFNSSNYFITLFYKNGNRTWRFEEQDLRDSYFELIFSLIHPPLC